MIRTAGALLSAVILSFCFPSGGLWWLAWVALVPLIICVEKDLPLTAFLRGYAAGFLFFLLTLFWIQNVTIIGLVLLCVYLAVYWGVFALAVAWSTSWSLWRRLIFLAAVWTALEYTRAHAFTGFGWSALAHTQSANILLIQIADISGAYALSFLMVGFAVSLVFVITAVLRRRWVMGMDVRALLTAALGILLVLGYGAWRLQVQTSVTKTVRVALVQANISLADYADPLLKPYVVEKQLALSLQAMTQKPELVIWPETAFPQFIWYYPELFEKVRSFAREHKVKILLGAVTRAGTEYFNSALLIDENGDTPQTYNKQHLVVLGEYIPFREALPILEKFVPIDDFTAGKGNVLFSLQGGRAFSTLICFEDTIPTLARAAVRDGAGLLVNITNDAWFGTSRQPRMHLDAAVFRAVENRRALVRATNTGMSCAIMTTGMVKQCLVPHTQGVVVVDVPVVAGRVSFYTKFGDVFAMLCFPIILVMLLLFGRRKEI